MGGRALPAFQVQVKTFNERATVEEEEEEEEDNEVFPPPVRTTKLPIVGFEVEEDDTEVVGVVLFNGLLRVVVLMVDEEKGYRTITERKNLFVLPFLANGD